MSRGETLAARWLHEPQPISNKSVGLGFSHRAERYRPVGSPFSSTVCWIFRGMEGFLIRGWDLILPGRSETSVFARGATLAARWVRGLQSTSNQPVGLGFPHRARRYRPGRSPFSSLVSWSWRGMVRFRIRRYILSSPGATGPRLCPEGKLSPRAGFTSPSQSATNQWGWVFHTVRGSIDPGDHRFRSRLVGVVDVWKDV